MMKKNKLQRRRPAPSCAKHPGIPATGKSKDGKKDLCASCVAFDRFGKETMGKAAADKK